MSLSGSNADKASFFRCEECAKEFSEKRNLRKHLILKHGAEKSGFSCALCDEKITNIDVYIHHLEKDHHRTIETEEINFKNMQG